MAVHRIAIGSRGARDIFKIYNLETGENEIDIAKLHHIFCNDETQVVVEKFPEGELLEVMYHNGVIDPEEEVIVRACAKKGITVEAAKVSYRYYGQRRQGVYVNKLVHVSFTSEPKLITLKPRSVRQAMQDINLAAMDDDHLVRLSEQMELHLTLAQMQRLREIQFELGLPEVTDVFLETFAARWSDHCFHTTWQALGLLKMLKEATQEINNPNLLSAFVDNAGVWDFYDELAILFKLETHNSPSQSEPYGGQMTKLGGVLRDVIANGLGAKPVGNIELTVIGEIRRNRYPEFNGLTHPAPLIGRETIRAIADYGNPMGVPMLLARMLSHPNFSGKTFALGGTVGITTRAAAKKGKPRKGDLAVLIGGKTGNDGLHGATVSSGGITEKTDTGDSTHVQIGHPYTEQKMMRAGLELRDAACASAETDFGAAGIVSAFGELGELTGEQGGVLINLALVPLKCPGLSNWQIALSESQERFAFAIKPEKLTTVYDICDRYELAASVIGVFTESGRFQMIYDSEQKEMSAGSELSGEVALDVPYSSFESCPLPKIEVIEPPSKDTTVAFPGINRENVMRMAESLVGHFDVCDQSWATTQYDSTVQGITFQGPLYGRNYNVPSSLAVLRPVYGKQYGLTVSLSFSPWQFEVDPVVAATNMMMDALATQVAAGVQRENICLADNFYTSNKDCYAYYYLREQVKAIAALSIKTGTPFITGKDSSSGSGTFGGRTANVPASVAITAMGKTRSVQRLLLHEWRQPGNVLIAFKSYARKLDGSILSAALNITGSRLDGFPTEYAVRYLDSLESLIRSGYVRSSVPINRGGIFLRLFEGVEASGFSVHTNLCHDLFTESFGGVLAEVESRDVSHILSTYSDLEPMVVGALDKASRGQATIFVQGQELDWQKLYGVWTTTFEKELNYDRIA